MTELRIRWTKEDDGGTAGRAGTLDEPLFFIYPPESPGKAYILTAMLPGHTRDFYPSGFVSDLKAKAEEWLAGFVSSLGAVFPDGPTRPSRAWHADWAEVDRDQSGNAILRHKPTGGMYKILPVEEC